MMSEGPMCLGDASELGPSEGWNSPTTRARLQTCSSASVPFRPSQSRGRAEVDAALEPVCVEPLPRGRGSGRALWVLELP